MILNLVQQQSIVGHRGHQADQFEIEAFFLEEAPVDGDDERQVSHRIAGQRDTHAISAASRR